MKVGWYFHRLRAMTLSELAHRVTERWKHRADAAFAESVRGIKLGAAAEGVITLPERDAAPEVLKQTLARDAASLMLGDWKLFGWRDVNVGTPPRWHRDVTCGVDVASDVLAHGLNHRALPGGADVRTVWEINRWSEMVRLAMHSHVNGEPSAARTAIAWLEDWCGENPAGYGINWTSPLEAGLRLMNFVWFEALARQGAGSREQGADALNRLDALCQHIVPAHAVWVWRYRSFGSSANNHLLGELVGLLHAVKRWPALEAVVCPAEELWQQISRCVLEQFEEDGGNKEQALHYHLFAWEMAWHATRFMRITDGPVMERLHKAAEFFVHMAHDREQWEYGDNDDAQIVPVTLERDHAVAEWRAWMRGKAEGEALAYWLGGPPLDGITKSLIPSEGGTPNGAWWFAPESGMATCERNGWKVRLDASPLGYGSIAAHGHCDALHVSIWDGPHALVIDPGTGGYYGMEKERARLAAWGSHDGPQPSAGFQTPLRLGAFLWSEHHPKPVLSVDGSRGVTAQLRFEGHDVARHVECGENGEVIVRDSVAGGGSFAVRWHLAPECEVVADGADAWLVKRDDKAWRVVVCGNNVRSVEVTSTASRHYGGFEKCAVLEVNAERAATSIWSRI